MKITTRTNRGQSWTAAQVLKFGKEIATIIDNRIEGVKIGRLLELIALKKGMSVSGIGHFLSIHRYATRSAANRRQMQSQKNMTAMLAVIYPSQNRSQKITMTRSQFEAAVREAVNVALSNLRGKVAA